MPSIDSAPVKIDYDAYLSWESKNRQRSGLKALRPYFDRPGMISLGGGYPHPETWPVNGMTLSLPFVGKSVFVPGYEGASPDKLLPLAEYVSPLKSEPLNPDLTRELQYGTGFGAPHFLSWLKEHVSRVHNPPYADWDVLNTAGNTDGVDGVLRSCVDRGDSILLEEFAYPGVLTGAASAGIKCVGVPMDGDGITATALDTIMAEWDEAERGSPRPKLLLLVPTCSNPTGATVPVYRKREIYAVCRKWSLLIIEDDPYYFLQIRPDGAASRPIPSFLSMDVDGRVIRVDSFSKIVAPGSRCGWLTGPSALIGKIMNSREGSTQSPSGFSVAAITAILRAWGSHEGFESRYLPHISEIYSKRCLLFISFLEKYVPRAAAEWPEGSGGMFLWLRLKIDSHPSFVPSPNGNNGDNGDSGDSGDAHHLAGSSPSPDEIAQKVFESLIEEGVLTAPSKLFKAPGGPEWSKDEQADRVFVRLSFSFPARDEMEEGVKRLGRALRKEWKLD
ncbi:hypothetical protein JCM24511_03363 [Saitozyma sp. JCM 24511]|nr:hypothetical protein JCM24511_03363 [Saitozyma sp. JCM 24511]